MRSHLLGARSCPHCKCVCCFECRSFSSDAKHNSTAQIAFFDECMEGFLQIKTDCFRRTGRGLQQALHVIRGIVGVNLCSLCDCVTLGGEHKFPVARPCFIHRNIGEPSCDQ